MVKKTVATKTVAAKKTKSTAMPLKAVATTLGPATARAAVSGSASASVASAAPRKVLVIIHGAGNFSSDYYVPFVNAIQAELGAPFAYLPAYYADVTNPLHAMALTAAPVSDAQKQFEADFQRELQRSFDAMPPAQKSLGVTSLATATGGAFGNGGPLDILRDVSREVSQYLFTPNVKAQIDDRLVTQLKAAQQYDEIILASLSLGTVVSFDVLKQFAAQYKTSYWFSCGCPLGKLRTVHMYDDTLGAINAQNVAHWWNIFDTTDLIADVVGPAFPQPGYRVHDIFVNVGNDPISSHDYFNNPEVIKMIAATLR